MSSLKTLVLKVDPKRPDGEIIAQAARVVREGGLVAFPTETVYGIAANPLNAATIDRLYKVKKRPDNKPLTVHISDLEMIQNMGAQITNDARTLIEHFWPGPITMILKAKDNKTIGFRMPAHEVALRLIAASGVPVVAPSANISGNAAPTDANMVLRELDGKIDIIIDAGKTDVGVESTVIDMTVMPPRILREGAVKKSEICKVLEG